MKSCAKRGVEDVDQEITSFQLDLRSSSIESIRKRKWIMLFFFQLFVRPDELVRFSFVPFEDRRKFRLMVC